MSHRALAAAGACLALAVAAPAAAARPAGFPADHSFIVGAAQTNLAEIAGGKLALSKSRSKAVRAYARTVVADHSRAEAALAVVARAWHTKLPAGPSAAQKQEAAHLATLSGGAFDREYLRRQIVGHRKALGATLLELDAGRVAAVRAYAAATEPVVKMHLQLAQQDLAAL
jgi:putative membrane protein